MSIKIAVIGANPANVEEIKAVVTASLYGDMEIVTATVDNYHHLVSHANDLVVCLVNRRVEMETAFGTDKVIALEFVPPTEYFLTLSKIPAGTDMLVFNNSTAGTDVLMRHLRHYDLMHINFEIVAYEELSYDAVAAKIAAARYITGGISYVGPGKALYELFGSHLSPRTTVIVSPPRNASSDSISRLCHAFSRLQTQNIVTTLERLAATDYLTQIPNRRTFDERLVQEWTRAQRDKTPLSLAMLDLDFFKTYNDHYGHSAGDHCLQSIASAIKHPLRRPADFCSRYGGEEFAVILPNTDSTGAQLVLEEIRQAVLDLAIAHGFSSIAPTLTISTGFTTAVPSAGNTPEQALRIADNALYLAKLQGRNRIVFHSLFGDGDI